MAYYCPFAQRAWITRNYKPPSALLFLLLCESLLCRLHRPVVTVQRSTSGGLLRPLRRVRRSAAVVFVSSTSSVGVIELAVFPTTAPLGATSSCSGVFSEFLNVFRFS